MKGAICFARGLEGWEPGRPAAKSLWLLPSGPDQVRDDYVRPTPGRAYGEVIG